MLYSVNVIKIAALSVYQVVLIYICMGVSVYWPMRVLCTFVLVWVCDIKLEY